MNGSDVYAALTTNRVTQLHHANTVTTSCTFLSRGCLASRGWVEHFKLPQTPQMSDSLDKKYGIWNDVFMDGVDIHARASRRNFYGPVLFEFPVDILLRLPAGTDVFVTKKNPSNWIDGEAQTEQAFASAAEVQAGYNFGDFGKHIVFRNAQWSLPFLTSPVTIILDDPKRSLANGQNAYAAAALKLQAAAKAGGVQVVIRSRQCSSTCGCLTHPTHSYSQSSLDPLF